MEAWTRSEAVRQQGFALLIVLWALGLLALLVTALAASGRSAVGVAANERGSAVAEAAADGAVQQTIFELRAGTWTAGDPLHELVIGHAAVRITIEDLSGRINPNFSAPPMLAALLGAVGTDPARALTLARAIVDWRTATPLSLAGGMKVAQYSQAGLPYAPPDRHFSSMDEIGQVVGMTPDLLARLQPYLSVYQSGDARLGAGATISRTALQDAAMIGGRSPLVGFTSPDQTVLIGATAVLADGTHFVRSAAVQIPAHPPPGASGWRVLNWR